MSAKILKRWFGVAPAFAALLLAFAPLPCPAAVPLVSVVVGE